MLTEKTKGAEWARLHFPKVPSNDLTHGQKWAVLAINQAWKYECYKDALGLICEILEDIWLAKTPWSSFSPLGFPEDVELGVTSVWAIWALLTFPCPSFPEVCEVRPQTKAPEQCRKKTRSDNCTCAPPNTQFTQVRSMAICIWGYWIECKLN